MKETRKVFEIWNFGRTRVFPYKKSNICLQSNWGFETRDPVLARALSVVPFVKVSEKGEVEVEVKEPRMYKRPRQVEIEKAKIREQKSLERRKKREQEIKEKATQEFREMLERGDTKSMRIAGLRRLASKYFKDEKLFSLNKKELIKKLKEVTYNV